jgi:hypothetical protein
MAKADSKLAVQETVMPEEAPVNAGPIPGAVPASTVDNVDADGRVHPVLQLCERFAGLGVTAETESSAYCGSGVTAAHEVLALRLSRRVVARAAGPPPTLFPRRSIRASTSMRSTVVRQRP